MQQAHLVTSKQSDLNSNQKQIKQSVSQETQSIL